MSLLTNPAGWNLLAWVRAMGHKGPVNRYDRSGIDPDTGLTTLRPPLPDEAGLTVFPKREDCPGYPVEDSVGGMVAKRLTGGRGWIDDSELTKLLRR
ncbi:MAG: hypothetical protein E6R03_10520 [Hyphomicrobiaceae bacterium]|nr:MAG: hypothetical protein E6R03_10520 [Hyphomicrobiaceae bacterium]